MPRRWRRRCAPTTASNRRTSTWLPNRTRPAAASWEIGIISSNGAARDISLFYFAGHGSILENSKSRESDHRDETIVPADANRGTADIRDKELARLFNRVIDRKADSWRSLTAVIAGRFRAGSAMRGKSIASRRAPAGPRQRGGDAGTTPPEDRRGADSRRRRISNRRRSDSSGPATCGRFTSALQPNPQHRRARRRPWTVCSCACTALRTGKAGGSVQETSAGIEQTPPEDALGRSTERNTAAARRGRQRERWQR